MAAVTLSIGVVSLLVSVWLGPFENQVHSL